MIKKVKLFKKQNRALLWGVVFLVFLVVWGGYHLLLLRSLPTLKNKTVMIPHYEINLQNGKMMVFYDENVVYESENCQKIQDFEVVDIDSNGVLDVVFILYDHKRFGSTHPFWMEEELQQEMKNKKLYSHLYVFELAEGECTQKWCSSGMPDIVETFEVGGVEDGIRIANNPSERLTMGERLKKSGYFQNGNPIVTLTTRPRGFLNGLKAKEGKGFKKQDWYWDYFGFSSVDQ